MDVGEMSFVKTGDARTFEPEPGMKRQVLSHSDQLMLVPSRGNPWRFEEIDPATWRRVPESADQITLVRQ